MRESVMFGAATHVGLVRANNEDNFAIIDHDGSRPCALILADGMGGHNRGELASEIAVHYARSRLIEELAAGHSAESLVNVLSDLLEKANVKVYLGSLEEKSNRGMGTTLLLAVLLEDQIILAHVGDCRAYLFREGELMRLTVDHTLMQEMLDAGTLTPDESADYPRRNVLTRALGIPEYIQPDLTSLPSRKGDRLLLCSDGLHGLVAYEKIKAAMRKEKNPVDLANKLVQLALDEGGEDNVTVLAAYL
ncbi:MAG: Stp1/IreP family PP2C-type Ser/Thr phosphatase [Clostridiaceae bacterium]|nr:Stp1/IreP family PP2C-type Ser/Thr phosphatase [Clostridiaceae bacterium]